MTASESLWKITGSRRSIPPALLQRAQELRKQQTPTEQILWECLRDRRFLDAKFRRQHNIGQFIADFYCHSSQLVIELDGEVHNSQKIEDTNRDEWMQAHGLTVLRFGNSEVLDNLGEVLGVIAEVLVPPLQSYLRFFGFKLVLKNPVVIIQASAAASAEKLSLSLLINPCPAFGN
jgi:very-short-patch-repair endonuclease